MLIENDKVIKNQLMGFFYQALAGEKEGLKTMEIGLLTLPPGTETPVNEHPGEVVVITLHGTGHASIGKYHREDLWPNTTLVIRPHVSRQVAKPVRKTW